MTQGEWKAHRQHNYRGAMGKSTVDIDCPYCGETITAYVWSLSGTGKKCPCGALHNGHKTLSPKTKEAGI